MLSHLEYLHDRKEALTALDLSVHHGHDLPLLVVVNTGYLSNREETSFCTGQVLRLQELRKQRRVLVHDDQRNSLSVPLDYPHLFNVGAQSTSTVALTIGEIVEQYNLPVKIRLADAHMRFNFGTENATRSLSTLKIIRQHEESYFLANTVVEGQLWKTAIPIPMYLKDVRFSLVTGVSGRGITDGGWSHMRALLHSQALHLDFSQDQGDSEIVQLSKKPIKATDNIYQNIENAVYISVREQRQQQQQQRQQRQQQQQQQEEQQQQRPFQRQRRPPPQPRPHPQGSDPATTRTRIGGASAGGGGGGDDAEYMNVHGGVGGGGGGVGGASSGSSLRGASGDEWVYEDVSHHVSGTVDGPPQDPADVYVDVNNDDVSYYEPIGMKSQNSISREYTPIKVPTTTTRTRPPPPTPPSSSSSSADVTTTTTRTRPPPPTPPSSSSSSSADVTTTTNKISTPGAATLSANSDSSLAAQIQEARKKLKQKPPPSTTSSPSSAGKGAAGGKKTPTNNTTTDPAPQNNDNDEDSELGQQQKWPGVHLRPTQQQQQQQKSPSRSSTTFSTSSTLKRNTAAPATAAAAAAAATTVAGTTPGAAELYTKSSTLPFSRGGQKPQTSAASAKPAIRQKPNPNQYHLVAPNKPGGDTSFSISNNNNSSVATTGSGQQLAKNVAANARGKNSSSPTGSTSTGQGPKPRSPQQPSTITTAVVGAEEVVAPPAKDTTPDRKETLLSSSSPCSGSQGGGENSGTALATDVYVNQREMAVISPTRSAKRVQSCKDSSRGPAVIQTPQPQGSTTATSNTARGFEPQPQPQPQAATLPLDQSLEHWTIQDVQGLLTTLKLSKYQAMFHEHVIDGNILGQLTKDILKEEFGMSALEIIRLQNFVNTGHLPK
ncbi:uncharacterized protein LOC143276918 [Babylonia areolata]|uniref:uncharacterized protein LOC143276918 n=1 Tax=Babylonia areolata TaxID=304850 RepID=UPI003FD6014D